MSALQWLALGHCNCPYRSPAYILSCIFILGISQTTFRHCRVRFYAFLDNLCRKSCKQTTHNSLICSDKAGLALETSTPESFSTVAKLPLMINQTFVSTPHRRSATISLETNPLVFFSFVMTLKGTMSSGAHAQYSPIETILHATRRGIFAFTSLQKLLKISQQTVSVIIKERW